MLSTNSGSIVKIVVSTLSLVQFIVMDLKSLKSLFDVGDLKYFIFAQHFILLCGRSEKVLEQNLSS